MPVGEFDLIRTYFDRPARRAALGVGDDCALLNVGPGMQLAVSSDMLVEGRHFVSTVNPRHLGHKALAVNLSDLAACGAAPLAYTLALSLPQADEAFLAPLSQGLHALADDYALDLIGGDTTAGPLSLCITIFGEVPTGQALLRSGAAAGDDLWVSGTLGDARLGLEVLRGRLALDAAGHRQARAALELPSPRIALGLALRGAASSAIDLSDGLLGDLQHLLDRSSRRTDMPPTRLGARIQVDALPRSALLAGQAADLQWECLLSGGDDYELLFTAPPDRRPVIMRAGEACGTPVTRVGQITAQPGIDLRHAGEPLHGVWRSHDHFRAG
jgi:thiamine-monophosphate kinase